MALRLVSAALPEARQANRQDIVFNLLLVRARAYVRTGQVELAERDLTQIRADAEALGYVNQLAHALSGLAAIAGTERRWREAITYSKQANALAERLGNDLVLGHTLGLLCAFESQLAQSGGGSELAEEALRHGTMSVEVLSRIPPCDSLALAHSYLTELLIYRGDTEGAGAHYASAIRIAESLEMNWLRDVFVAELGEKVRQMNGTATAPPRAEANAQRDPERIGTGDPVRS